MASSVLKRPSTAPPGLQRDYEITDSGNSTMKVVVRVRPENEAELRGSFPCSVKTLDEHVLVFDPSPDGAPSFQWGCVPVPDPTGAFRKRPVLSKRNKDLRFAFDRVFDETASQADIFEHTTRSIVEGVLDGINCSAFAYGATGAGKTYTMLGSGEHPGVMFLTMMELYQRIADLREEKTCEVAVSYCEVYNEAIHDLLVPSGNLELREDAQKGLVVSGLSQHQPRTASEILDLLEIGNGNRTQHPTDANATSSRSHAVFQVFVTQKARTSGFSAQVTRAKMSLIDLAGSERATVTTNRGARLREGANINKSLLALGNCINALADSKGKPLHVPYRNSKLTRLLKDSLGGNCRTVMIANVSPSGMSYEDTYNTLKYADRAKQIKTKCVRNVHNVDYHVTRYRAIVEDLQSEISELKARLERGVSKKDGAVDTAEAGRLQGLVQGVYGERSRLRKQMADLDAAERETLLRQCRKQRDILRIDSLTGNEAKKAKLSVRVDALGRHAAQVGRHRQQLHERLSSNNESLGRVQAEVSASCGASRASASMRQLLASVTKAEKMDAENAHQWKQTKHLLKAIKSQERDIGRTERILTHALELVRRQHSMLRANSALTGNLRDMYDSLVRLAEGEKEVAWADQSTDNLHDTSASSLGQSQLALIDSFVSHASPASRKRWREQRSTSPSVATSLGILTKTGGATNAAFTGSGATPKSRSGKRAPATPSSVSERCMRAPVAAMLSPDPDLVTSHHLDTTDSPNSTEGQSSSPRRSSSHSATPSPPSNRQTSPSSKQGHSSSPQRQIDRHLSPRSSPAKGIPVSSLPPPPTSSSSSSSVTPTVPSASHQPSAPYQSHSASLSSHSHVLPRPYLAYPPQPEGVVAARSPVLPYTSGQRCGPPLPYPSRDTGPLLSYSADHSLVGSPRNVVDSYHARLHSQSLQSPYLPKTRHTPQAPPPSATPPYLTRIRHAPRAPSTATPFFAPSGAASFDMNPFDDNFVSPHASRAAPESQFTPLRVPHHSASAAHDSAFIRSQCVNSIRTPLVDKRPTTMPSAGQSPTHLLFRPPPAVLYKPRPVASPHQHPLQQLSFTAPPHSAEDRTHRPSYSHNGTSVVHSGGVKKPPAALLSSVHLHGNPSLAPPPAHLSAHALPPSSFSSTVDPDSCRLIAAKPKTTGQHGRLPDNLSERQQIAASSVASSVAVQSRHAASRVASAPTLSSHSHTQVRSQHQSAISGGTGFRPPSKPSKSSSTFTAISDKDGPVLTGSDPTFSAPTDSPRLGMSLNSTFTLKERRSQSTVSLPDASAREKAVLVKERPRGGGRGGGAGRAAGESVSHTSRKVPNYLQMTKASSFKRVQRTHCDKENQVLHSNQGKLIAKTRKPAGLRPIFGSTGNGLKPHAV